MHRGMRKIIESIGIACWWKRPCKELERNKRGKISGPTYSSAPICAVYWEYGSLHTATVTQVARDDSQEVNRQQPLASTRQLLWWTLPIEKVQQLRNQEEQGSRRKGSTDILQLPKIWRYIMTSYTWYKRVPSYKSNVASYSLHCE